MVLAHHLIATAYGWWLPNDPRGSNSTDIRVVSLQDLGPLHFGRKIVQPSSSILREFFTAAGDRLKHEPLLFSEGVIKGIGQTIGEVIKNNKYTCYACAVMPEHMHLLIRRHRDKAEEMLEKLQEATRNALIKAGHRAITHPV